MVSQQITDPTESRGSRASILAAATEVFMEVGFSGARVEQIAQRASANKAMIYYHFGSKKALYKAVLMDLFGDVLAEVERLRTSGLSPALRLRSLYIAVSRHFENRKALPPVMLREILAGGGSMDGEASRVLGTILGFVAESLKEGVEKGVFRPVHPLVLHLSVMAPLMIHHASATFRERMLPREMPGLPLPTNEQTLAHLLEVLDRSLSPSSEPRPE